MPVVIKLKRGATPPSSLAEGEVAVNTVARRLYIGPTGGGAGLEIDGGDESRAARLAMTRQAVSTSAAALAIDLSAGWHVALSLANTITAFTFSNVPASGKLCKVTLDITNTGAFTIAAWPPATKWAGGVAPVITSGAGKLDTIVLTTGDGGATWRGYVAAQNLI